jgi:hypothetical protein
MQVLKGASPFKFISAFVLGLHTMPNLGNSRHCFNVVTSQIIFEDTSLKVTHLYDTVRYSIKDKVDSQSLIFVQP